MCYPRSIYHSAHIAAMRASRNASLDSAEFTHNCQASSTTPGVSSPRGEHTPGVEMSRAHTQARACGEAQLLSEPNGKLHHGQPCQPTNAQ